MHLQRDRKTETLVSTSNSEKMVMCSPDLGDPVAPLTPFQNVDATRNCARETKSGTRRTPEVMLKRHKSKKVQFFNPYILMQGKVERAHRDSERSTKLEEK